MAALALPDLQPDLELAERTAVAISERNINEETPSQHTEHTMATFPADIAAPLVVDTEELEDDDAGDDAAEDRDSNTE
jgi:hypothetical protein